jgi:hypothetical protein
LVAVAFLLGQGTGAASNANGPCTREKTRQPANKRVEGPKVQFEETAMVEWLRKKWSRLSDPRMGLKSRGLEANSFGGQ